MPSTDGLTWGVILATSFCSIGAFGFGIDNGRPRCAAALAGARADLAPPLLARTIPVF